MSHFRQFLRQIKQPRFSKHWNFRDAAKLKAKTVAPVFPMVGKKRLNHTLQGMVSSKVWKDFHHPFTPFIRADFRERASSAPLGCLP